MRIVAKLFCAAYLLLTSLYCLLAFLPYTYYALIKAPVYDWMPWFARHHSQLYWLALLGMAAAYWPARKTRWYLGSILAFCAVGVWITALPFMTGLQSDFHAYAWSLAAVVLLLLLACAELRAMLPRLSCPQPLDYAPAVCAVLTLSPLTLIAAEAALLNQSDPAAMRLDNVEIGFWVVITHAVLALIIVSLLNLIFVIAAKSPAPRAFSYGLVLLALCALLSVVIAQFLDSALSFSGWPAKLFAVLFSVAVVAGGFCAAVSLRRGVDSCLAVIHKYGMERNVRRVLALPILAALGAIAVFVTPRISEWDWNGLFQRIATLFIWVAFSSAFYFLWPSRRTYSQWAILAVLLVTAFSYKGLQAAEIFWAKPLGATDEDIGRSMELYASKNTSFELAHHLLGNSPEADECGELCRILRQYTNIRDASTNAEVRLADPLLPTKQDHPDVFVIIVDSMRPDYLGVYNPKVDFTPNIDDLAKDSAVFRNAYTQYAGTTLSEPAIWSGAMLLHAHYPRPFQNVNSLEKLMNVDGYRVIVSFDTVLQQILSPADKWTKLDTDKVWRQFEFCSTVDQLNQVLDRRGAGDQPVFFYAQPMNVHQFARNRQPTWRNTDWNRPGFMRRVALEVHQVDDCMGKFIASLRAKGLYDNSIIIVASDHGEALGDFGRYGHSYVLYPEVLRVPLIVHLPKSMRHKFVYDPAALSTLTDITPSLYYLLGHRPLSDNPLYGHSLFAERRDELEKHNRHELFFASDEVAAYGLLQDNARRMYATYDSPARSVLFDLASDPNAEHSILTASAKQDYDRRIIDYLKMIANFYGYKPGLHSLLAASH